MNGDGVRRLVDATMLGEVVDSLGVAVFVTDSTLRYLAANEAAAALLRCTREELVELRVADVVDVPEADLRAGAYAAERESMQVGTVTLRRCDGTRVEVVYATMAARMVGLPVLLSLVQPSTESGLGDLAHSLEHA